MRYFLWLSFDGTDYHGWQIQPSGISVQERLQKALSTLLRQDIAVTGAGRTDAGVHARQMVCHFDVPDQDDATPAIDSAKNMLHRLNSLLPRDISCNRLTPVGPDMHARFSATRRTYRYFIHTRKDPFLRRFSVETHYPLDFHSMNEAAEWLTTQTDFRAFCKAGADNRTTICHVTTARWVPMATDYTDGDTCDSWRWYFEISADRFLRNMVRAVVGTLFDVGRGRRTLDDFKHVVSHGTRSSAGESMPANGLFLWKVEYGNQDIKL